MISVLLSATGALALDIISYNPPIGFTTIEDFDYESRSLQLMLLSADGNLSLMFAVSYCSGFEWLDLASVSEDNLPSLLAEMRFDTDALGVAAKIVAETDAVTDEEFAYIIMYDEYGQQDHIITIGADGWIEYAAIVRNNGPLTDEDYELQYRFYDSIEIAR
jgi:hypothetical protein